MHCKKFDHNPPSITTWSGRALRSRLWKVSSSNGLSLALEPLGQITPTQAPRPAAASAGSAVKHNTRKREESCPGLEGREIRAPGVDRKHRLVPPVCRNTAVNFNTRRSRLPQLSCSSRDFSHLESDVAQQILCLWISSWRGKRIRRCGVAHLILACPPPPQLLRCPLKSGLVWPLIDLIAYT